MEDFKTQTEIKAEEMPVAVRIAELKRAIANAVAESKLPPCVIEPIFGNVYNQIATAAEKELSAAIKTIKKEEG